MADNSSIPVAVGNETFANKDIAGVKYPKHIPTDSTGAEIVPATEATLAALNAKIPATPATTGGQATANASLAAINTAIGAKTDDKSTATDTTSVSAISLWKQISASVQAVASALAGTLTVATHAVTQSGSWVLSAGSALIGKVDHSTTGIGHGVKTVTTAGTDLTLAASTAAKWVTIQAQTDNTGVIAVGATGVDATIATGNGVVLSAGQSITIPVDNLSDVFIDATVSGEGVRYTYGT